MTESTLKVAALSEEVFYFGFAEGDQVIFNFEEMNGKALKEIEILELPSSSKFMDYESKSIQNKILTIANTGIYKFRFNNTAIAGRVCKIKIQRIPASESTKAFNTSVYWRTEYDTTWLKKTRQVLVRVDTVYDEVSSIENQIWLYSRGHMSCLSAPASCTKNKIRLTYHPDTEELLIYTIADQKTAEGFNNLAKSVVKSGVKAGMATLSGGSSLLVQMFINPLVGEMVNNLPSTNTGNKVDIFFTDKEHADFWYTDVNNTISVYEGLAFRDYMVLKQRFLKRQIPANEVYMCLKNNSSMTGVPVYVGVVAKRFVKIYQTEEYEEPKVTKREIPYLKN